MFLRDVEWFMACCDRKGLAEKTKWSYEQTLRLFALYLSEKHPDVSRSRPVKTKIPGIALQRGAGDFAFTGSDRGRRRSVQSAGPFHRC